MNELARDPTRHEAVRFTVDDFVGMEEAGVFARHGRTELIDGAVLTMNAQHRRHSRIKNEIVERLRQALRDTASDLSAWSEVSIALPPDNMPEPDIVILADDGGDGPVAAECARLVIEVADTTLAFDLGEKAAIYAGSGLPEYWVVDIGGRRIFRHHAGNGGTYDKRDEIPFGEPIAGATIAGLTIETTGL